MNEARELSVTLSAATLRNVRFDRGGSAAQLAGESE
jgi:hypothetical protein